MKPLKNTKKRLDWSITSQINRKDIFDYIEDVEFNVVNALLVDSRILATATRLQSFPLLGIAYKNGLRLAHIPKTQYTIVYRVTDTSIRILRVTHQKRKVI